MSLCAKKNVLGFFKALDVDGVGSGVVKKLIAGGYETVPDILLMREKDFLAVEGFKETLANKIYTNIQHGVKDASLPMLMKASNIFGRGFGERKLKPVLEKYPGILLDKESDSEKVAKLESVEGWSTKTSNEFVKHIPLFNAFMKECGLEKRLNKETITGNGSSGIEAFSDVDILHSLYGKRIVITGFRPKEFMELLESKGAILSSSVSKKTFAVIVKTLDEDTGKAEQGRQLGVSVMTPEAFKQLYKI